MHTHVLTHTRTHLVGDVGVVGGGGVAAAAVARHGHAAVPAHRGHHRLHRRPEERDLPVLICSETRRDGGRSRGMRTTEDVTQRGKP